MIDLRSGSGRREATQTAESLRSQISDPNFKLTTEEMRVLVKWRHSEGPPTCRPPRKTGFAR